MAFIRLNPSLIKKLLVIIFKINYKILINDSMASLKAQYDALKQQHQFTVMQLSDLKEDYEKIKKLNTTILQNMMKQSFDGCREIKVNIDGNLYNQRIIDLQAQLELLRNKMNDQIQRRVQQIIKNHKVQKPKEHDCQKCQKCLKILEQCPNCKKLSDKLRNLQKFLEQKTQRIDVLRLQVQQKKSELQIIQSRKNHQMSGKLSQKQQINKILESNIKDLQKKLSQNQGNSRRNMQQLQDQYNQLYEQYQAALAQLQQYRKLLQQQEQSNNLSHKKNNMMKQIQNIMGQLGNRKSSSSNVMGNQPKLMKYSSHASRILTQDSDFSNFSIKDAINRPNQFTFY